MEGRPKTSQAFFVSISIEGFLQHIYQSHVMCHGQRMPDVTALPVGMGEAPNISCEYLSFGMHSSHESGKLCCGKILMLCRVPNMVP